MPKWPYSDPRWPKLRKIQLTEYPLCAYCLEMERHTPATVVDHIEPVRDAPELAFEQGNFQSMCKLCHDTVKRSIEQKGFDVTIGADGWPIDPNHPANKV